MSTPTPRLLLLTPEPGFEERWQTAFGRKRAALTDAGAVVEARPWTAAGDLAGFDMVLPLFAWGYQRAVTRWYALLDRLESEGVRTINPVPVLRWNSDKAYLADLAAAGVKVVPTRDIAVLDDAALALCFGDFGVDRLVVKPPISGGADGTVLVRQGQALPAAASGKRMLVQPLMPAISAVGEYSLFWFGGQFSHAIVKRPATGDFRVQEQFGGRESAWTPTSSAMNLSRAALAASPASPVYARVDMVGDAAGVPHIMELELIEPSLFLNFAPDQGGAFARAVLAAL